MSTIRGVKDRRFKFVQLLNEMFENPTLSLKAKGFIGFCLTKKENWDFHVSHLCSVLKEGERAIYSVINECIEHGYAYRHQPRSEDGKMMPVEFIISDSKEEIKTLKKEFEEGDDLKKCLPDRQKGDAVNPRAQNVEAVSPRENKGSIYSNTDNSNIRKQQQQQPTPSASETPDSVVVLPDSPPVGDSPVEKILLSDSKGKQTTVYKQALFSQCVLKGKDWLAEEIEKAWEVLKQQTSAVNNWFAFVEGIINNNRKVNKIKQIDNKEHTCQTQNTHSAPPSKKPYCSINGVITEIGTPGLHLQNLLQAKKYQK